MSISAAMHCQGMLSVMLYFLDMLGRNSAFEITEARHLEVMLICQLRNEIYLVDVQGSAQREVFITSIQCQNHGFCHACIGCVRREAEVEMKIYIAGHVNNATFDYQYIVALQ